MLFLFMLEMLFACLGFHTQAVSLAPLPAPPAPLDTLPATTPLLVPPETTLYNPACTANIPGKMMSTSLARWLPIPLKQLMDTMKFF